jgi:two-component system, response regulator, stage 0 sporulation protein F
MSKVLIVEDEPHLLNLYRLELEDEGYHVETATDGALALDVARRFDPDLVILDIKLGKVEGLEVLQELKAVHKDKPVILNSAYSHYKNEFTSWLADAYITKSSDLSELKDKISELIGPVKVIK